MLIQAGLVPSKHCVDLSSQAWRSGGFSKADGSLCLFPLSCLFGWAMPLPVMSLPSQEVRGEKYVWENGNRLWNVLFSLPPHPTTSYFLLLGKSTWQVFSSHCQFCYDASRRQEYHSKNIFAVQGCHCCQFWGFSLLLIKAPGWWSVDLGPGTISAVWV